MFLFSPQNVRLGHIIMVIEITAVHMIGYLVCIVYTVYIMTKHLEKFQSNFLANISHYHLKTNQGSVAPRARSIFHE